VASAEAASSSQNATANDYEGTKQSGIDGTTNLAWVATPVLGIVAISLVLWFVIRRRHTKKRHQELTRVPNPIVEMKRQSFICLRVTRRPRHWSTNHEAPFSVRSVLTTVVGNPNPQDLPHL
jgi:hypothetical protein